MQYEVLYLNDDKHTAKVRMTINGSVLEQDFEIEGFESNVLQGMAIFKAELAANQPISAPQVTLNTPVTVADNELPTEEA